MSYCNICHADYCEASPLHNESERRDKKAEKFNEGILGSNKIPMGGEVTPHPEKAHSPLPWSVYRCQFADEIGEEGKYACGFNGHGLDASYDECHHTLSLADADFIVTAVNHHDKLVEAVQNMIYMMEGIAREKNENPNDWANYKRLIALLKSARGETLNKDLPSIK